MPVSGDDEEGLDLAGLKKHITVKGSGAQRIKVVAAGARKVSGDEVARALGAERVISVPKGGSPFALNALRRSLVSALRSTGGRPGLEGAERRQKIPMSDADWQELQRLADALSTPELTPTAGQVAAQLLHEAIRELVERRGAAEGGTLRISERRAPRYRSATEALSSDAKDRADDLIQSVLGAAERWRAQDEARGRLEGQRALLTRLLTLKFGELPAVRIRQLESAAEAELVAWTDALLSAESPADVFAARV